MMEQSFTEETLLAALRDIRLPSEAAGGPIAELLVCIGLALLVSLVLVALARLVFQRPARPEEITLADEVAEARSLAEPARRIALLHLLKAHAPERYQALSKALYAPDALDPAQLEAEVARLV